MRLDHSISIMVRETLMDNAYVSSEFQCLCCGARLAAFTFPPDLFLFPTEERKEERGSESWWIITEALRKSLV